MHSNQPSNNIPTTSSAYDNQSRQQQTGSNSLNLQILENQSFQEQHPFKMIDPTSISDSIQPQLSSNQPQHYSNTIPNSTPEGLSAQSSITLSFHDLDPPTPALPISVTAFTKDTPHLQPQPQQEQQHTNNFQRRPQQQAPTQRIACVPVSKLSSKSGISLPLSNNHHSSFCSQTDLSPSPKSSSSSSSSSSLLSSSPKKRSSPDAEQQMKNCFKVKTESNIDDSKEKRSMNESLSLPSMTMTEISIKPTSPLSSVKVSIFHFDSLSYLIAIQYHYFQCLHFLI